MITPTVSADLTVNLQSGGGSATDGQDLTLPGSLTITANNVSGSASIPITDDHVDEDDETITLGMALQSPDAVVGTNNSYTLTIQDNDTSGFTLTPSGALTANEGTSTSYSIVLTSQPTADVTVTLGTDASQLTLPGGALTFTSANWDTPQLVNVDVNDNAVDDGDRAVHITHTVGSSDPKYSVLTIGDKVVNVTDNDTTGITVDQSSGSTAVTEGGAADSYTVVLTSQPTADVTVDLTNGGQIQVNPSSLTFTAGTWNVPQTVTVTAVDNQIAENPLQEPIHQAVTSADPLYAAVSLPDVDVAVTDDDTADITLTQSNGVTAVVEGSTTDSYTVVLTSQPTADVNVALSHSAQVQTSANTLTFTGVTWNVPQTVTVTAVDDDVAEGAHADTVSHLVTSADPFYDGFGLGDVNVQVGDNDAAGLQVVESNASSDVVEGSTTDSITVALTSQPTQQVDVALGTDAGQLTANPGSLQFNAGNWDQPQQVDLAAVNDDVAEDATVTPLSFTTTSADSFYDGAVTADVNVQVGDNDTAALFTVTNDGETVEEGGSSAQFTLQLTSQPTADVQVDLAFNDQVIDTDTQALQFTAGTWSTPQAVMVFAVDDDIAEGVHDGAVDFTAVSADSKYNGSTTSPIAVSVIDNDSAGVVVTESSGSTLVKEGRA
ncbi:MAG: Calx-beta domain-containing protein [Candidatus Andersenbacteria bacterium]